MSNIIKTPRAPYYDDFDKAKKFLRILFRPGLGVQTRELNQLQSILDDQLSSFADFFFQNGQKVTGGEVSVNDKQAFVKLQGSLAKSSNDPYLGATIRTLDNTLAATIAYVVRSTNGDPDTLYLEYRNTSTLDNVTTNFSDNSELVIEFADGSIETVTTSTSATGFGSLFTVREGIYYVLGQFVQVDEQTLVISKYVPVDTIALSEIGFEISSTIVTPEMDNSLLDNALGSDNETAPGAHRLRILAELKLIADVVDLTNFVKIATLQGSTIVTQARETDFTVFEEILAKRTYDESGDYIIDDFLIEVREHLDNGSNRGLYPNGDEDKLGIVMDPGKAYVRGYEVSTSVNTLLETDKARTTSSSSELLVDGSFNSAFICSAVVNLPSNFSRIDLLNASNAPIGHAFVKATSFDRTTLGVDYYRVDFFAPTMNSGSSLADVASLSQTTSSFTASVSSLIYDARSSMNIFEIPFGFIQNVSDLDFAYYREYSGVVNGTDLPITTTVNDQFPSNETDFVVSIGGVVKVPVGVVRSSGNTQATLDVTNFGSVNGQSAKVIARTIRNNGIVRTKSLTQITQTIPAAAVVTLSKCDVVSIVSITAGSTNVKDFYALDGGQRDTHYERGVLRLKDNYVLPAGNLEIVYSYFEHGAGDFFAPQSYENINYSDIPYYTTNSGDRLFLGSVLDFRPRYQSANQYELAGAMSISSTEDLSASFTFYLSRRDKVCLDKTGKFTVVKGVPAVNPVAPLDLDAAITLYELNIPAYTFKTSDVKATKFNLKRYTMKDIAKLESRLETVEYATSLSLLESDANQKELFDKFKCGFLVDNFKSQNVGDFENAAHQIGVDLAMGEARAIALTKMVELGNSSGSSNIAVNDGIATLPYTEVTEINQNLASSLERLQPYTLFNWIGTTKLTPSVDQWVSTEVKPDVIINNGKLGMVEALQDPLLALGSSWSWWSNDHERLRWQGQTVANLVTIVPEVQFTPIPYIRSRDVVFEAYGLKPNTKVIPYFDGVDVSEFVRPTGGALGDELVASGAGTVVGVFSIPNTNTRRFRTGKRLFVLADVGQDPDASNTYTEATYVADGTLQTITNKIIRTTVVENRPGARRDPLAQTFAIEKEGGGFVTSIEVYFGPDAADNDQDVTLELRGVTNGYPNEEVIARKILPASSIAGSFDASVGTKFTFDYPVYLEQDLEYCFVMLSNSLVLTTWLATLGERSRMPGDINVSTGEVITKQPFIGSLFKSQNNITWTAAQTQDLKFKVNRASFDVGVTGLVNLTNQVRTGDVNTEANPYRTTLAFDPFEFDENSNTFFVYDSHHGFRTGDSVTLSGPSTGTMNGIPVSEIYGSKIVGATDSDGYYVTAVTNATTGGRNGGNGQLVSSTVEFSTAYLNADSVVLNGTGITYRMRAISRLTDNLSGWTDITNRSNEYMGETLVSKTANDSSIQVQATLTSTQENISPVLDLNKIGLVGIKNRINNDPESLSSDSGAAVRYLQKSVTLVNPANEITVYADVSRPSVSTVEMFYRVGQASPEEQEVWAPIPPSGNQPSTEDQDDFKEYKWKISIPTEFFAAKVKIVFRSPDESKSPKMKNLRVLYLNA